MNMTESDLTVRIDVLDLLIAVLKDHEATLSENISRLEAAVERISAERRARL